ncbi:MAG: helix-turn-helix transcriptional regulator [Chitinophagaceae bacterium]
MAEKNFGLIERFGEQLAKVRGQKGLSLRQLSQRCNIGHDQISRIENGKANITLLTLFDLAEGLEVHPKKLLEFKLE